MFAWKKQDQSRSLYSRKLRVIWLLAGAGAGAEGEAEGWSNSVAEGEGEATEGDEIMGADAAWYEAGGV